MPDRESKRPWHAGRMLFALARYFDWWNTRMITEFEIDGGRADLLVISRAGYATEIEIKITRKDWRIDGLKDKFAAARPHVSRLFYAVPEPLYQNVTKNPLSRMNPLAGILVVRDQGQGYDSVREARAAKRLGSKRIPPDTITLIERTFYYRYWRLHMNQQHRRLTGERKAA